MTNLEELKTAENLKDYAERNLTKGQGGFYHCPVCGQNHKKATLHLDGNLFKCFYGGCETQGSVIDLIMAVEGLDTKDAIRRTRELYDRNYNPYWTPPERNQPTIAREEKKNVPTNNEQDTIRRDFRNYFKKCKKRISETDYPRRRGLDDETIERFNLGYDPEWTSPSKEYEVKLENEEIKKQNKRLEKEGQPLLPLKRVPSPSPRLIIPIGNYNYLARDVRPDDQLNDFQKSGKKLNEGKDKPFFNLEAAKNPLCFFLTEGEIDAMSIEQAGGSCVGLGTSKRAKAFGEWLQQQDPEEMGTIIIALDNDDSGRKEAEKVITACQIAGIDFLQVNVSGQYNDPNDYLVADRKGFYATVKAIIQKVRAEKLADYELGNAAHTVNEFMRRPDTAGKAIPTGFKKLDDFLDGGLCSGLVFIGGLSSLGKTTLALQIAEHIATNKYPEGTQDVIRGRDVLYFALEQSKFDLTSKILSRRTFLKSREKKNKKLAKMNIQLLQRERWQKWPQNEWDTLWECYKDFEKDTGNNLRIIESTGDITALDIVKTTKKHIAITGRVPIIIVDYLQILKPIEERMTDKQAIDRTITTLKRLSRDYDTTVIGISSFNRENYWARVSLTAFKDSGNLEYSADILFAIAPANMVEGTGDKEKTENKGIIEKCRDAEEKQIELHVLKNRNGKTTGKKNKLFFKYHSLYNHFEETEVSDLDAFGDGNPAIKQNIYKKL